MTDQTLRKIAEAEALRAYPNHSDPYFEMKLAELREAHREGFIAGRTSVTREQILEVVAPFMHDEFVQGQETPADEECADAVLALLNGGTDD